MSGVRATRGPDYRGRRLSTTSADLVPKHTPNNAADQRTRKFGIVFIYDFDAAIPVPLTRCDS